MASPVTIILLGRVGSGKGTQAEILKKKYGYELIETGALVRPWYERQTYAARKLSEASKAGYLTPWWFVTSLWVSSLLELPEDAKILFDGSPRSLKEADVLDEVLDWLERKDVAALLVEISPEEAKKRLLLRKRVDDTEGGIERRLKVYEESVAPVVEYYEKKGQLVRINGEQSVEDVAKEIEVKLGLA